MNDTTPEVARIYRDLLMSRSGAERFRMGCELFDTAKAFALAGLRARGEEDVAERLFLRLYGSDFNDEDRSRIVAAIKGRVGVHGTPYGELHGGQEP